MNQLAETSLNPSIELFTQIALCLDHRVPDEGKLDGTFEETPALVDGKTERGKLTCTPATLRTGSVELVYQRHGINLRESLPV